MNVKELIAQLRKCNPEADVIVRASNGWGPGPRRSADRIDHDSEEVIIYGRYF